MHDIEVEEKVLAENDRVAAEVRRSLSERGVFAINLVSSPGSGKTTLVERSVPVLKKDLGVAVIEGDLATELDSRRVARLGVPVRQITTGRACHLDANMVRHTLPWVFENTGAGLLVIENVGNMVCPAEYDLGENLMVSVMSTTEGDDKPLKYPAIFRSSGVLVINKTDLAPYTDFDTERAKENALSINPDLRVFETSCRTGAGIQRWCEYLLQEVLQKKAGG